MKLFGKQITRGPAPQTQGVIHAVPCPHCGKPNDFRELDSQQLLDTGHEVECDACHRTMQVAQINVVKVLSVRPVAGAPVRTPQHMRPAQQATTISPAQLNKLLKR